MIRTLCAFYLSHVKVALSGFPLSFSFFSLGLNYVNLATMASSRRGLGPTFDWLKCTSVRLSFREKNPILFPANNRILSNFFRNPKLSDIAKAFLQPKFQQSVGTNPPICQRGLLAHFLKKLNVIWNKYKSSPWFFLNKSIPAANPHPRWYFPEQFW